MSVFASGNPPASQHAGAGEGAVRRRGSESADFTRSLGSYRAQRALFEAMRLGKSARQTYDEWYRLHAAEHQEPGEEVEARSLTHAPLGEQDAPARDLPPALLREDTVWCHVQCPACGDVAAEPFLADAPAGLDAARDYTMRMIQHVAICRKCRHYFYAADAIISDEEAVPSPPSQKPSAPPAEEREEIREHRDAEGNYTRHWSNGQVSTIERVHADGRQELSIGTADGFHMRLRPLKRERKPQPPRRKTLSELLTTRLSPEAEIIIKLLVILPIILGIIYCLSQMR